MNKQNSGTDGWYGPQVLSQWVEPTNVTADGANVSYNTTVVDDGWEVPTNDEQLNSMEDGPIELCKLLRRVGPRRFYALLDLWGISLTDELRAEVLRLEQCNCGLDEK